MTQNFEQLTPLKLLASARCGPLVVMRPALACLTIILTGCSGVSDYLSRIHTEPEHQVSELPARKSDLLLKERVRAEPLPPPPLQLNAHVLTEMKSLARGRAACIRVSLERKDPLKQVFEQIFLDEGVPNDLLNLAVIESRFDSLARSKSGAVGIWQFTRGTAKEYGLRVDGKTDQRRDPILSTIAAARMLRELYFRFKDWYLALAAYNAGPGAISRALTRTGATNFWELSRSSALSRQTNEFVPRFIAATLLVRLSELYGVDALQDLIEKNVHERQINRSVDNLAALLDISPQG